jgi:hypothetical protein
MSLDPKRLEDAVTNHEEAFDLAHFKRLNSNLARCYIERCAQLAAANARIAELEAAMQWRDISTAPKDGTPYLSCTTGDPEPVITWWGEVASCTSETKEGFCTMNNYYANFGHCRNPTHWLPLPTPPAQEASDEA